MYGTEKPARLEFLAASVKVVRTLEAVLNLEGAPVCVSAVVDG
jgi:hypothetical protein